MGFPLTVRAQNAAQAVVKRPNLVLVIDGISTKFGSAEILKIIRIGDPGLLIDGSWQIGGSRALDDQLSVISFDQSSTSIKQQLEIDKGRGSSISSLEIGLIDQGERITRMITPGLEVADVLGRRCSLFLGFAETTNFPEDYVRIFRGIVDDIIAGPGLVRINIAHPEQKKKASIYNKVDKALSSSITDSDTTIPLNNVTSILTKQLGPDGTYDSSFRSYVRIDNELISYDGISGSNLTGCVRAQLGTINTAHASNATVSTLYRLTGNVMDLALKVMMTKRGEFALDVPVENFQKFPDGSGLANAIYFKDLDVADEYGLTIGDYCTTTGASSGANNFTLRPIEDIQAVDGGSYIVVSGASLADELDTGAVIDFRSQYDTLPEGLGLGGDEVDVEQHTKFERLFLSNFEMDFYLKESIENGREWIEQELYKPCGAYSLNRKAKASVGFFVGPIPSVDTKTISKNNITNPSGLKLRRTITKNFANTIIYKYEIDPLEDKFLRGTISQSATSLGRIPVGGRALVVESTGMRDSLLAESLSAQAATRRLNRFKFGAEFLDGIQLTFGDGYAIELGDILLLDSDSLSIVNTEDGNRVKEPKLFEVVNIEKDFKTGKISINLIDTNFDGQARYGLIGPSSKILSGISQTQFTIYEGFYSSPFGVNEYRKWSRYALPSVKVRSADFTTRYAQSSILSYSGNTITLTSALGFTPQADDVMELSQYDSPLTTEQIKLIYAHMRDTAFADGKPQYQML